MKALTHQALCARLTLALLLAHSILCFPQVLSAQNSGANLYANAKMPGVEKPLRLRYRVFDNPNPPLRAVDALFLHGSPGSLEDFYDTVSHREDFAAQVSRAIFVDVPGYAESERPWESESWRPTFKSLADTIYSLDAVRDLHAPVVVAHSYGALIALAYAVEHPADVSALVLLSPVMAPKPGHKLVPPFSSVLKTIRPVQAGKDRLEDDVEFTVHWPLRVAIGGMVLELNVEESTSGQVGATQVPDQVIKGSELQSLIAQFGVATEFTFHGQAENLWEEVARLFPRLVESGAKEAFGPNIQLPELYLQRQQGFLSSVQRLHTLFWDSDTIIDGTVERFLQSTEAELCVPVVGRAGAQDLLLDIDAHFGVVKRDFPQWVSTDSAVLPDCGHMIMYSHPEVVAESLAAARSLINDACLIPAVRLQPISPEDTEMVYRILIDIFKAYATKDINDETIAAITSQMEKLGNGIDVAESLRREPRRIHLITGAAYNNDAIWKWRAQEALWDRAGLMFDSEQLAKVRLAMATQLRNAVAQLKLSLGRPFSLEGGETALKEFARTGLDSHEAATLQYLGMALGNLGTVLEAERFGEAKAALDEACACLSFVKTYARSKLEKGQRQVVINSLYQDRLHAIEMARSKWRPQPGALPPIK